MTAADPVAEQPEPIAEDAFAALTRFAQKEGPAR